MHIPPSGTDQYVKHSWIAHIDNQCVGHTHLHVEPENRIKFLDAWVHPDHRRKGIFRYMWDTRWDYVKENFPELRIKFIENTDFLSTNWISRQPNFSTDPLISAKPDFKWLML